MEKEANVKEDIKNLRQGISSARIRAKAQAIDKAIAEEADELEKEYLPKYHKVLSYKKIFEVQGAESRFHREMLRGINHQKRGKGK